MDKIKGVTMVDDYLEIVNVTGVYFSVLIKFKLSGRASYNYFLQLYFI